MDDGIHHGWVHRVYLGASRYMTGLMSDRTNTDRSPLRGLLVFLGSRWGSRILAAVNGGGRVLSIVMRKIVSRLRI